MNAANSENDSTPPWASSLTSAVSARDKCCRLSEKRGADYFTRAHLVPHSEKDKFETSGMEVYKLNRQPSSDWMLDDIWSGLHLAFDDRKFVIVPQHTKWDIPFLG